MESGLAGKVVLITGAANGIGRAAAIAFAGEGANLGLLDHDRAALDTVKDEAAAMGVKVSTSSSDLATESGVSTGIREALSAHGGRLDVLVNNVGAGAVRSFDQLTDADWDATMNLNFMSYVRACRVALPILRERGGVIVNNASDLARQPEPVPVDYSVSKAAILALTKGLARAEAPKIRVNAVAPGPVWTPSGQSRVASPRRWASITRCRRRRLSNTRCRCASSLSIASGSLMKSQTSSCSWPRVSRAS